MLHAAFVGFELTSTFRSGRALDRYAFRQQSDFYYLSGYQEPDALLVLGTFLSEGDRSAHSTHCLGEQSNERRTNPSTSPCLSGHEIQLGVIANNP